jgi:subtilase family serine protease
VKISVENFGLSSSTAAEISLNINGKLVGTTAIGALAPYARTTAAFPHVMLEHGTCEVEANIGGKAVLIGKFDIRP